MNKILIIILYVIGLIINIYTIDITYSKTFFNVLILPIY